jgi:hypothetical protein
MFTKSHLIPIYGAIGLWPHLTVKPGVSVTVATSQLEYPCLVLPGLEPPLHGPPIYAGKNEGTTWIYFKEAVSDEDWSRHNQWITAQAETHQ